MSNFLVLIHDVFNGNVVRQIVVKAEDAIAALAKVDHLIGADEHAVTIPTGSEPDTLPEPETEPETEPVIQQTGSQMSEPVVPVTDPAPADIVDIPQVPGPVIPPPPDPSDLILDELHSLPPDVYQRVRAALLENG